MSDDELAFNAYQAAESPFRVQKYVEPPTNGNNNNNNNNSKGVKAKQVSGGGGRVQAGTAVAGPSKKPPSKTRPLVRKRSPSPAEEDGDVDELEDMDDLRGGREEVEEGGRGGGGGVERRTQAQVQTQNKRAASREPERYGPPVKTNAKTASRGRGRGKGKGRAQEGVHVVVATARDASPEAEHMMVDDSLEAVAEEGAIEDAQEQGVDGVAAAEPPTKHSKTTAPSSTAAAAVLRRPFKLNAQQESASWKKREERHRREIERYDKQLKEMKSQRDHFAKQVEEVFQMRNTEAEANLEQQRKLYESRLETSEEMIRELTSQLARVDSLTREGKTSTLHFLTREAADEERRDVERQVEQLKAKIKEKDIIIAEREAIIRDKDAELSTLEMQLNAEIERSKQLTARSGGKDVVGKGRAPNGTSVKPEGLKQSNAYRLYEDMTNILIIDCRCELAGDTDEEQWVYSCLYSLEGKTSLSFSLRTYDEPGEDGVSVAKVAYSPGMLSDDSREFTERLDFLADEFTFQRKQLDVFLDKLYTTLNEPLDSGN